MAEIIKINKEPKFVTVTEDYIKNLEEIVVNYKEIEKTHKIVRDNLFWLCDRLISTAMMGDYGENDEKTMMELKELNKILMDHKSGKEIKKEILT